MSWNFYELQDKDIKQIWRTLSTQPLKSKMVKEWISRMDILYQASKDLITWGGLTWLAGQVSDCRDPGTFVKCHKNKLHDYMTTGPARLAEILGSRLTELRFFHVIAYSRLPGQHGSLALRHTKIKLAPVSYGSSHQPSTGLARLM